MSDHSERQKKRLAHILSLAAKRQHPVPVPKTRVEPKVQPKTRSKTKIPHIPEVRHLLFISGGIGDMIALESFLPEKDRESVTTIFYGTRKHVAVREMFSSLPNYKNLTNHVMAWTNFDNFWCFHEKRQCIRKLGDANMHIPDGLLQARDWSIGNGFPYIRAGQVPFVGSSLLINNMADVSKFDLPATYAVVCPFSNDKRDRNRDFTADDWKGCRRILRELGIKGVVINQGDDAVEESDEIINLSNKTNFPEAVEILKKADRYIGIDSCLSILAAQLFQADHLAVKSVNKHCIDYAKCYFAPYQTFPFLVSSIN